MNDKFISCPPWRPGNRPPTLPLTVIGVVKNKPVLVWYYSRTRCWHDNPAAFGSVPVEWWQYLPDCELLKADMPETPLGEEIDGGNDHVADIGDGWAGDGTGEDDLADYNQNEADDYRDE